MACGDLDRSEVFWRDTVGLSVYREYGTGGRRHGVVLFCGGGFLELTAGGGGPVGEGVVVWLQVAAVDAEADRLRAAGVAVDGPRTEPWGLREAWFVDPDGLRVALIEVPEGHPIRTRLDP